MRRRDVERHLHALEREQGPGPDENLVEDLAGRLRSIGTAPARRAPSFRRQLGLGGRLGLATATAGIAALLLALILVAPRAPEAQLMLAGASDAVVVFSDGTEVVAIEGLVVPEGATIRTGPSGRVRANGAELGPNRQARVAGGRLVGEGPRPLGVSPLPGARPSPAPTSRPAPEPSPGSAERPALTPQPSPEGGQDDLALDCRSMTRDRPAVVACRWTPSRHPDFVTYVLWRSEGAERRPVYRTPDRSATEFIDQRVEPDVVFTYVVQAIDTEGNLIASGGPVRVRFP